MNVKDGHHSAALTRRVGADTRRRSTRRALLLAAASWVALAGTGMARAQPAAHAGKPVRVGLLETSTPAASQSGKVFVDTLRELGWVEGRNIVYDRVYGEGDETRLPALAAALVARSPDLLYASNHPSAVAIFAKTRTIPIIFSAVANPDEVGLVQSLARPGGNATGIANIGWELSGKRMQLLKEVMPSISRVGVLRGASNRTFPQQQKLIEEAAGPNVKVIPALVTDARELDAAFAFFAKNRVEAVITSTPPLFMRERKRIVELATRQRIPVIGYRSQFADDEALMSYASNLAEQVRRAAQLADKVLRGTKPADIPVEQPTRFELVVNMKTAKALGITIPQSIMLQATRVIE